MYLLKDKDGKTAWLMAAICGKVEVLERLWDWAKKTTAKSRGDKV